MTNKIAVIAAHPDDEILGCGAAIAKHVADGDEVHTLILAEGATSRDDSRNRAERQSELSVLSKAAYDAASCLGVVSVKLLDFPDNRMDSVDLLDIVKAVELFLEEHRPNLIYTHHPSDVNIDHYLVYRAVITAARPVPGQFVQKILAFETLSSSEWMPACGVDVFKPNYYVPVEEVHLQKKLQALQCYAAEMRSWPHSRSYETIEHLMRYRGSSIGHQLAEAFEVIRLVT